MKTNEKMKEIDKIIALLKGESEKFIDDILAIKPGYGSYHWEQFASMWKSGKCKDTGFLGMTLTGLTALIYLDVKPDVGVGDGIDGPNLNAQRYGGSWYIDNEGFDDFGLKIFETFQKIYGRDKKSPNKILKILEKVYGWIEEEKFYGQYEYEKKHLKNIHVSSLLRAKTKKNWIKAQKIVAHYGEAALEKWKVVQVKRATRNSTDGFIVVEMKGKISREIFYLQRTLSMGAKALLKNKQAVSA